MRRSKTSKFYNSKGEELFFKDSPSTHYITPEALIESTKMQASQSYDRLDKEKRKDAKASSKEDEALTLINKIIKNQFKKEGLND